jgi:putative aldouronate transport system permease protein
VEESAFIDGASHLTVFFRIVLPLSKPVLATIALFTAVSRWNDYFSSVMYIQDSRMWALGQVLRNMVMSDFFRSSTAQLSTTFTDIGMTTVKIRYATIIISAIPMLMIYPFAQRYFITGLMIGSVKG